MATIAFYEKKREEQERKDFVSFIQGKSTKYVHTNPDNELNGFDILFVHQPDFSDLKETDRGNQTIKTIYAPKWIILFGGNPSNFQQGNKNDKIIQYINYNDIKDRFDEIKKDIESLTEITKQILEDIIFAIDPKLEELLEPFATYHPLAALTGDLKVKKTELLTYVNKKLGK